MNMEISSALTMMVTILAKVSDLCISLKVLTPDGEAIGNMENIRIRRIIHTRSGWMKGCISRVGLDKLRTLFLRSLIFITVRREWYIILGRRWVRYGRTSSFWLNSWAIQAALTSGRLA